MKVADISSLLDTQSGSNSTVKKADTGENAFLKLLVEQLKHQDPLAPQDGSQFVAQLAQFNSLEQLISINDRLAKRWARPQRPPTETNWIANFRFPIAN